MNTERLLNALQAEKLQSQERRGALVARKLGWVSGLGAVGLVELPVASHMVLYLVPVISMIFDLYILGEDFGIKRMGVYVGTLTSEPEAAWECWVRNHRDQFSWWALPVSSAVILAGCGSVLLRSSQQTWFTIGWLVVVAALTTAVFVCARSSIERLKNPGEGRQ